MTVRADPNLSGSVFGRRQHQGCNDILIAVTDGLKGTGEALAVATLQTCIVHLIRNSLDYTSWKDCKTLAAAIKPIYTATSAEAALAALNAFEQAPWGTKFPTVVASWRRAWDKIIPFFAFPSGVRRVICTTNVINSVNARLRKTIKTRGHFPSGDAATKLIWLALRNITKDRGRAGHNWKAAMNQFAILYEDRFTKAIAYYCDRLSHRVGWYVVGAVRRRGKISQRLTHRNSDTPPSRSRV